MRTLRRIILPLSIVLLVAGAIFANERERKLAEDRKVAVENGWIYDDLKAGYAEAKETGKPMLVVVRCPP